MTNFNKFNPNEHLIQIKNKQGESDYLPVQFRLVWFREAFPHGTIETELIHLDLDKETEEEIFVWSQEKRRSEKQIKTAKGVAIFRATVRDGQGGIATGTKMEKAASFADFLEKSETGAIGRALAALGYGTQFAPELSEEHRIVDAPVDRAAGGGNGHDEPEGDSPATEDQIARIRRLGKQLGKVEPELAGLQYLSAKAMLIGLAAEYNRRQSK